MKYVKFLLIALLISCIRNVFCAKLQEKFRWKEVSYAWPNEASKEDAIKSGRYQPENNLPLGLEVWKDKLFITVPRYTTTTRPYYFFPSFILLSQKLRSGKKIPFYHSRNILQSTWLCQCYFWLDISLTKLLSSFFSKGQL